MVEVDVHDEEALTSYVNERYEKAMGPPGTDDEETMSRKVLEALVLSNENPSPLDYGIEIRNYGHRVIQTKGSE